MNTEASWVFIFPTPYPRSDVLSAKTEKAVGQVPPLGSPLRRTLETFRAWVSYFLVVDCEEMTLASSHSVCCWTVFPKWVQHLHFKWTGFNAANPPPALGTETPPQATLPISPSPHSSFNSSFTWGCSYLQLMVWDLNKAAVVQRWAQGRLGGSWSVLLISFTLGCHNLLYFLLFFFCCSFANLSDGPNVLT